MILFEVLKVLHALHLYNHAKSKTFYTFLWIVLARTLWVLNAIEYIYLYEKETTIDHRYMLLLLQLDIETILYIVEGSSSHVPIPHNITIFLLGSVHNLQLQITPTCYHNDNYIKVVHFNKYAYGYVCQHFSIYEQSICCLLHFYLVPWGKRQVKTNALLLLSLFPSK